MGVIISTKEQIDAYFKSEDLGQSSLKSLENGVESFLSNRNEVKTSFYQEKGHFIIGSGVDTILTGQEGQYESETYVSELDKKPSDAIMSMVVHVYSMLIEHLEEDESLESFVLDNGNSLADYQGLLDQARAYQQYNSNLKVETFYSKMITEGDLYFQDLIAAHGKQVVDQTQDFLIKDIVMSLKTHSRTSRFFDRETQQSLVDTDVYYQLPVYFVYKGVKCKALMDLVIVVKNEDGSIKAVFPYDVKTMSGLTRFFPTSVKVRRYDIQAAWYTLALQHFFGQDIVISPFKFIVESTTDLGSPLVFECHESLLNIGRHGRGAMEMIPSAEKPELTSFMLQRPVKGYEDLLEDFIWYEANGWEEDKTVKLNKGFLLLDWNGIKET
jgi:hypothetical protein